jgi:cytochrome c
MDSFELNKIIGAILGTLLFVMGAGFLAEAIYDPLDGRGPGYELPEPEGEGGEEEPVEEEEVADIGTLLAAASAEQGEGTAGSRCGSCHNFAEGAGNKQGPELYGVVARPIASHAGFTYSDALEAHSSDTWTYENLSAFLLAPQDFAPGTKMSFGGLKNDQERANVIAYLSTLSASPVPFPAPATAEASTPEAVDESGGATTEGEAVPTTADAVRTPTETQSETPVQGTPTSGAMEPAPATEDPSGEPATEAPSTMAPMMAPAAEEGPAGSAPAMQLPAEGEAAPAGEMSAPAN